MAIAVKQDRTVALMGNKRPPLLSRNKFWIKWWQANDAAGKFNSFTRGKRILAKVRSW